MELPELKTKKHGSLTDINGVKKKFKINRTVSLPQSNYPKKTFVLQEIEFEDGKQEIRVGYYIIGKKPKMKDKWVWGQFCPMFPKVDLEKLIEKGRESGIIYQENAEIMAKG
jgi:hypothetical protein